MVFWALVGARWVQFSAATILLGTSLFPFYALPSQTATDTAQLTQTARRAVVIAALAGAASAVAWVAASIVNIAEDAGSLFDPETLSQYFLETSFGKVWAFRLILAIALMVVVLLARGHLFIRNGATGLVVVLAGALLVSQAWIGHPASLPASERSIVIAAYAVHVLGAAVWLGALLPLGFLVVRARRGGDAARCTAEFALRRFSPVGMIAIASILLGGVVNAISRASSFDAFAASTWGQIVILKIAIASAMIFVAALNRFVLMPRLSEQAEIATARLARNIAFEQAAGLLILAAAALLGVFHPPHY